MAKPNEVAAMVASGGKLESQDSLSALIDRPAIKKRFEEVLGKKAHIFMSSMVTVYNSTANLKACDPKSIISAAMMAATLDLAINQSLGFAHIVPYGGKAQFQMGWKGFVQLAMRSGQYKTINVCIVYEGQLKKNNPFTGEMEFQEDGKTSDKIVGYMAYFRLLNGFEKYLYMTKEEAEAHGKRYSKSYSTGQWSKNFDSMALKTVIKLLLSKFGILSVEMQRAVVADQGVIVDAKPGADEPETFFPDNENDAAEPFQEAQVVVEQGGPK